MKNKKQSQNNIKSRWMYSNFRSFCILLFIIELAVFMLACFQCYTNTKNYIYSQKSIISRAADELSEDRMQTVLGMFENNGRYKLMAVKSGEQMPYNLNNPDSGGIIIRKNKLFINIDCSLQGEYEAVIMEYPLLYPELCILFWAVILALIFLALSFYTFRLGNNFTEYIRKPVSNISRTAKELAAGKSSIRAEHEETVEELEELIISINEMADRLEKEDKMQNDFISSVSHELRTPLTAIMGWTETMSQSVDCTKNSCDTELLKKGFVIINSEAQRLLQMVEELLDFSKMESNRIILHVKEENIAKEFETMFFIYKRRGQNLGITMKYYVEDDFPRIKCDKNRMKQVFINLVDNALKYCSYGDTIVVTLSGSYQESRVKIVVSDTGKGISKESLERVKEKFYKEDYTKRGSGIGLAICDEIVYLHGGTMDIESRVDCGTTITINMPTEPPYNEQIVVEKDDSYKLYY